MPACPRCARPLDFAGAPCAHCGPDPTSASALAEAVTLPPPQNADAGLAGRDIELLPGHLVAGRYRIVARVGRGGMGVVYRADDLTLGQTVALKFMAGHLADSPARRERFISEVRVARQITHPNVCRVHDIGFRDDDRAGAPRPPQPYLSMEFVDGEDLASLLRRIGRLPPDKATQVASQICAGLAAAHAQGVLHRDLKPANIMLDGRGHVRITDFGLAAFARELAADGPRGLAGTPAYMAPEQLAARSEHPPPAPTVQTDVYALGLVLYELFTGERAIRAETLDQIQAQTASRDFVLPGTRIKDLDPAVEAVIMRCLEPRPADRPSSAAAVAAALPGADPLAGALAAGQTPDPSVLAASGSSGRLSPASALGWLAAVILAVLTIGWLNRSVSLVGLIADAKPREVLADRARELLRSFGYDRPAAPGGAVHGVRYNLALLDFIEADHEPPPGPGWWPHLLAGPPHPAPMDFWYRHSPALIDPGDGEAVITPDRPLPAPGEVGVRLDLQGRLTGLWAAPSHHPDDQGIAPAPESAPAAPSPWPALLAAAGIAPEWLTLCELRSDAAMIGDARAAWTMTIPDGPLKGVQARIEAASLRGRPVLFHIVWPWGVSPEDAMPTPFLQRVILVAFVLPVIIIPFIIGAVMARRNWLAGRGDRRGAIRVALGVTALEFTAWMLVADHSAALTEYDRVAAAIGGAMLEGFAVWMMYLAIEPAIRRRRPRTILAWTRLTSGRWDDPMVARDALRGIAIGAAWCVLYQLAVLAASRLPDAPAPTVVLDECLRGPLPAIGEILSGLSGSTQYGFIMVLVLLLTTFTGRAKWPARAAFALFVVILGLVMLTLLGQPQAIHSLRYLVPVGILTAIGYFFILARLGLLTAVSCTTAIWALIALPTTFDSGTWYGSIGLTAGFTVIAAAAWAAWTAVETRRGTSAAATGSISG